MVARLKLRPTEAMPVDRRGIVQLLASMDEAEFRAVADEARGASLIPMAELVIEGLAATVGALVAQIGEGAVVYDDLGRPCTTRDVARGLRSSGRR